MSHQTDLEEVKKRAEQQGFRVTRTNRGHWQFYAPNKEDIITVGGTPGDWRGWQNFIASLKRAGYDPGATTPLAEALEKAVIETPLPSTQHLSISDLIKDVIRNSPDRVFQYSEVVAICKARRPEILESSVGSALSMLYSRGTIARCGKGQYRWSSEEQKPKPNGSTRPPTTAVPDNSLGVLTGDVDIDADLHELDDALAALSRIETVVRRNREVLIQLQRVKVLLSGTPKAETP